MKIITRLEDISTLPHPISLTIGTFDALHKGHLFLIDEVVKQKNKSGTAVVLTFSPSPYEFFHPKEKQGQLIPSSYRMSLLEKIGIDLVICLTFTKELSLLSYDQFLDRVFQKLPFDSLVLGKKATLGKDGQGDEEHLTEWVKTKKSSSLYYLPVLENQGQKISSSLIRNLLNQGKLEEVKKIWGTPFFLFLVSQQKDVSSSLFSWKLENQSLPPDGLYELAFSYPPKKGQKTFLGFLFQNTLKICFSDPLILPEEPFLIFFLKKRKIFTWLEGQDYPSQILSS